MDGGWRPECGSVEPAVVRCQINELRPLFLLPSSHEANQKLGSKVLDWQTGYGVVSFGTGDLPWIESYVRNQCARHQNDKVEDRLERIVERSEAEAEPREGP